MLARRSRLPANKAFNARKQPMKKNQISVQVPQEETGKIQWNTRVRPEFKKAARLSAAVIDGSQDDIVELAILALLGSDDPRVLARKAAISKAWHAMGNEMLTLTRDRQASEEEFLIGAVSSVVEHRLDTAGVTGSNPVSRTIFTDSDLKAHPKLPSQDAREPLQALPIESNGRLLRRGQNVA